MPRYNTSNFPLFFAAPPAIIPSTKAYLQLKSSPGAVNSAGMSTSVIFGASVTG